MLTRSCLLLLLAGACEGTPTTRATPAAEHWELAAGIRVEKVDPRAVAGPDAFRQQMQLDGVIETREAIDDGFVTTIGGVTYVVREIGRDWYSCSKRASLAEREVVITACKAFKR